MAKKEQPLVAPRDYTTKRDRELSFKALSDKGLSPLIARLYRDD